MKFLRGWIGETKTALNMWFFLDSWVYQRTHNVIIPSKNGTTQIDHLLVSPYGVFIVETKNMKGWIFGSEDQPTWTQALWGEKFPFQNPIRQTFRQKKVLAEFLELDESFIHTVIYFTGDCKFKTPLPSNVIRSGLGSHIKQYQDQILSPEEISRILKKIGLLALVPSLTTKEHVKSLRERHSSTTICPKCGSGLVERRARSGPNYGAKFLGCSNYPKCRFIRDIS
ncbi:MAG: NERD domain-containing protein [Alphaproteobacteria bacterium]